MTRTFQFTAGPRTATSIQFGGQPSWLGAPMWPISRSTNRPMRFLCQAPLPPGFAGEQRMAYVFMTDDGAFVDGTWEPNGGENAVILQPGPFVPVVATKPLVTGPTLQRAVKTGGTRSFENVEIQAEPVDLLEPEDDESDPVLSRYTGEPAWIQSDETPPGGGWRFLLQIDSATERYELAFGDLGVGYVFVSQDGTAARFFYQCF